MARKPPHVPSWEGVKASTASRGISLSAIQEAQYKRDSDDDRKRWVVTLILSNAATFVITLLGTAWVILHLLL